MKLIIFLLILTLSQNTFSYEFDHHISLSKLSYQLTKHCGYEKIGHSNSEIIAKWSKKEDTSPYKSYLWTRLRNWHFYNAGEDIQILPFIKKTFHSRWLDLLSYYANMASSEGDKDKIIGSLIHYIQDVTNPSHVVPVYHGPGIKDAFDSYPIRKKNLIRLFSKSCLALEESSKLTATEILDKAANRTFTSLKKVFHYEDKKDGKSYQITFGQAYWRASKKGSNDFFGNYGRFGNNFGKEGRRYKVDTKTSQEFALQQQLDAVIYGAALILVLN